MQITEQGPPCDLTLATTEWLGVAARRTFSTRRCQTGFSYLALLFFIAISAIPMAHLGQRWQAAVRAEKARELSFRLKAYEAALLSYYQASLRKAAVPLHPRRLDELLIDHRAGRPHNHLRRLYPNPMSPDGQWHLILGADGTIRKICVKAPSPSTGPLECAGQV